MKAKCGSGGSTGIPGPVGGPQAPQGDTEHTGPRVKAKRGSGGTTGIHGPVGAPQGPQGDTQQTGPRVKVKCGSGGTTGITGPPLLTCGHPAAAHTSGDHAGTEPIGSPGPQDIVGTVKSTGWTGFPGNLDTGVIVEPGLQGQPRDRGDQGASGFTGEYLVFLPICSVCSS